MTTNNATPSREGAVITIGNASMWAKPEIAKRIRQVCDKYDIPMSTLMATMIEPQMEHIERFALLVQQQRKEWLEQLEREKRSKEAEVAREKVDKSTKIMSNLKQYKDINLFDEWRKLDHNQAITDARIANINEKLDRLIEALGEPVE
jgi:hypothetical protein